MTGCGAITGMRRAALLLAGAAALLAGCGSGGSSGTVPATATAVADAPCTQPALTTALRANGTAKPIGVENLRCKADYALTDVREGPLRATILWQRANGGWSLVDRTASGVCPQQGAVQKLCTAAPRDPSLRRCTQKAFLVALRDDVDQARFRVGEIRCSGDYARTAFILTECGTGQKETPDGCSRARVAAWRRDATRWRLITYRDKLDCPLVQAAAPKYPTALCSA
jgi:hypothetical protein